MDLSQVRLAIASNALGKSAAGHDIHSKLVAAKAHGFSGIELAFECLEAHASSVNPLNDQSRPEQLQAAASDIQRMASRLSLEIIALQPFGAYDLLEKAEDIEARLEEADLWLQLCHTLKSHILQVCMTRWSSRNMLTAIAGVLVHLSFTETFDVQYRPNSSEHAQARINGTGVQHSCSLRGTCLGDPYRSMATNTRHHVSG